MIIERPGLIRSLSSGKWSLVYGRRKTGKTFLVKNGIRFDEYYFVRRDRTIITTDGWSEIGEDVMMDRLRKDLKDGRTIVIDEFHRLGTGFMDILHSMEIAGRLVLISSTLHLSRNVLSGSSPLLGKVVEVKVPPIDYADLLRSTGWYGKERYELLSFMKEPLVIAQGCSDPVDAFLGTGLTVPALIGEVFTEEDRKLSATYEAVLRACAIGRNTSGEVSSFLFSKRLLEKDDPSLVQQYLRNLTDLGILRRYDVWGKRRNVFKHVSPLIWTFYAMDERYGTSERDLSRREARMLLKEHIPHIMEDVLRDLIADHLGARPYLDHFKEDEVDGILVRFNRPFAVIEIKWKGKVDTKDIDEVKRKFERFDVPNKFLIVPDRANLEIEGVEVLEPRDILGLSI